MQSFILMTSLGKASKVAILSLYLFEIMSIYSISVIKTVSVETSAGKMPLKCKE